MLPVQDTFSLLKRSQVRCRVRMSDVSRWQVTFCFTVHEIQCTTHGEQHRDYDQQYSYSHGFHQSWTKSRVVRRHTFQGCSSLEVRETP
jgi:hypothetical protein